MSDYYPKAPVVLHYGPPTPPPSTTRESVGRVLTILASVFGPPAAAFTAFCAAITWSGCFIECSQPHGDHTTGGLLWLLAVALLLAGPVLAASMVRRATCVIAAIAAPFLEVGLLGLRHLA